MAQFTWLHLTDLHCGMRDQDWMYPTYRERWFQHLAKLYEKTGGQPWDLVLFTGDLVQKGTAEEFNKLNAILDALWQAFERIDPKNQPKFLPVPGNHDLIRPTPTNLKAKDPSLKLLLQWQEDREIQDEFWENPQSPYRKIINKAFRNYTDWFNNQPLIPKDLKLGMLPGDFAYTLEKEGAKLGIFGLNTAFLQLQNGDYEGKLALHTKQFHAPFHSPEDGPAWASQHQACLLLTHHPQTWLDRDSQQHLRGEINLDGRFIAHLCGHMHDPSYRVISENGAFPYRTWIGRSLFGLEYYNTDCKRSHGYSIGKIEFIDEIQGQIYFYPIAHKTHGLRPDDDKIALTERNHTKQEIFPLLCNYKIKKPELLAMTKQNEASVTLESNTSNNSSKFIYNIFVDFSESDVDWVNEFTDKLAKQLRKNPTQISKKYVHQENIKQYLICSEREIPRFFTKTEVLNGFIMKSQILIVLLDTAYADDEWYKLANFLTNKSEEQCVILVEKSSRENILSDEQIKLLREANFTNIFELRENISILTNCLTFSYPVKFDTASADLVKEKIKDDLIRLLQAEFEIVKFSSNISDGLLNGSKMEQIPKVIQLMETRGELERLWHLINEQPSFKDNEQPSFKDISSYPKTLDIFEILCAYIKQLIERKPSGN